MIDIKKLTQQKNELKELWEYLGIDAEFPDKELRLWLVDYSKELIESAFQALARKIAKAKKGDGVDDPVKYLGGILRNCKEQNMTPEQREAHISELRGGAARVKAHKAHLAKVKAEKQAFAMILEKDAEVCRDLQKDAEICPNLQGVLVEVPVPVQVQVPIHLSVGDDVAVPVSTVGVPQGTTAKAKAAAAPLSAHLDERKEQPKPPTKTNGISGVLPKEGKTKTPKPRICGKNGKPFPPDYDTWAVWEKLAWRDCICDTHECEWGHGNSKLNHIPRCPVNGKPKPPASSNGLGNVAGL